ncbi:hypothetical protein ACFE04_012469 [Oxalis oulophora]
MATAITSRIRLVKCPKCQRLLPEIADVPVYRCGGCDTILVAKNKKIQTDSASSSGSTQVNSPEPTILNQKSEKKELTSSIHGETSEGCSSLKNNDRKEKNLPGAGKNKHSEDENISNEHHNNNESDQDEPCNVTNEFPVEVNSLAELANGVEGNDESSSPEIEVNRTNEEESATDEISQTDDSPPLNSEDEVNNERSHSPIMSDWPGRNHEHREASKSLGTRSETDENMLISPRSHSDIEQNVNRSPVDLDVNDNKPLPLETNETFVRYSSQRSSNFEYMSTRTSFHAHQRSVSSLDENDEKSPDQSTYGAMNAEERHMRRGKFPENEGNFSSHNNHYSADARMWNQEEMMGTGFAGRNYPRAGRGEFRSHEFPVGYGNGSTSNQFQNRGSSSYSHGRQSYPDDKMNLLRMVYELQNQLDHTLHVNNIPNGRRAPVYYEPESFEGKIYQDVHPHPRYMQGRFSGEAINNYKHHEYRSSAEFPLSANQRSCHCNNCDLLSYNSCPASPMGFEYHHPSWSWETKSDDPQAKKYQMERKYKAKRLTQPKVGAAPLIACYNCFKLLHLPADFLLFKQKCHKLRCGSCLEILQFSLQGRTHIVPYVPNETVPRNKQKSPISDSPEPSKTRQPRSGGSPLHRLMGYDSASEVLFTRELTSSASSSGSANLRQVPKRRN